MLERSSTEVLKELLGLLVVYQDAIEEESRIKNERIGALENEVHELKAKNAAIARILTED